MIKKSPELRISDIEEKYPNQWVVVDITEKDKYGFPVSGKVLLQESSIDLILNKIESFQGDLYTFYTGSIDGKVE
ncbi:MAG: hypothetical protein F6K22_03445 [Okeania sp. SIO2F4]|uniref:hypothetical protein n=1 Tax=Okeania sp. SIO2F4 TaxID=2607790 RepID=UPI00142AB3CC|nr:hypothetical protein [Okeania sp. SIO2F4]NES01964.1 hypothetical protein [Okeania sp. SIO2F4]